MNKIKESIFIYIKVRSDTIIKFIRQDILIKDKEKINLEI